MNCIEHHLPELELSTGQVRDALQCLLHTVLFIRSPGPVTPCDVQCEDFGITYSKISSDRESKSSLASPSSFSIENDVDRKVDDAIESFLRSLSQIGPELLSGCLTLSFFERRASRQLFGLVSHEERVVWEQWILRIVVNNTPRPLGSDSAAIIERQRIQDTAKGMLRAVLEKAFELSAGSLSHIPPTMYEFEITSSKRVDDRESAYSRATTMPPILNLGS
jgi:autophagy-related protein 101